MNFYLKPKQKGKTPSAEKAPVSKGPVLRLSCKPQPKHSPVLWLFLLLLSAAWFAAAVLLICRLLLPAMDYALSETAVALTATGIWLVVVIGVGCSVKKLHSVVGMTLSPDLLTVELSDGTRCCHCVRDADFRSRRVKAVRQKRPGLRSHFKLTVTDPAGKIVYDVLPEDEGQFAALLSRLT